jgi:hypothetical protein
MNAGAAASKSSRRERFLFFGKMKAQSLLRFKEIET